MKEEELGQVVTRIINDLTLTFPADSFPGVAAAVAQMRSVYLRELRTKKLLADIGISLPLEIPDLSFVPPLTGNYRDDTTFSPN
jgi:hypothetical protein